MRQAVWAAASGRGVVLGAPSQTASQETTDVWRSGREVDVRPQTTAKTSPTPAARIKSLYGLGMLTPALHQKIRRPLGVTCSRENGALV